MKSTSLAFYYFQSELGESLDTPNAFPIPSMSITFSQFLEYFPVRRNSSMIFRFQTEDKTHGHIWIDALSPTEKLPTYMGNITAKILLLDANAISQRKTRLRRKAINTNSAVKTSTPILSEIKSSSAKHPSVVTANGDNSNRSPLTIPTIPKPPSAEPVAIFFEDSDVSEQTPVADHWAAAPSSAAPSPDIDLWSFPTSDSTPNASGGSAADIDMAERKPSLNREQLVEQREAQIEDRVKAALEFKQEVDENMKREAEELEVAKAKHDRNLTAWAMNNNEKRNVRVLLSNMHTVLWPGHKWKAISLGDIIEAKQVKLQYRKAMLVVHPDRCSTASAETRFIAKRVFEAINEAYEEFLKKEGL